MKRSKILLEKVEETMDFVEYLVATSTDETAKGV